MTYERAFQKVPNSKFYFLKTAQVWSYLIRWLSVHEHPTRMRVVLQQANCCKTRSNDSAATCFKTRRNAKRIPRWKQTSCNAYTGCPRRNVPDFGRVFLMLKYTDITQNTYIQSWTVTEIMAWEKWGLLAVPNTATYTADVSRESVDDLESGMQC